MHLNTAGEFAAQVGGIRPDTMIPLLIASIALLLLGATFMGRYLVLRKRAIHSKTHISSVLNGPTDFFVAGFVVAAEHPSWALVAVAFESILHALPVEPTFSVIEALGQFVLAVLACRVAFCWLLSREIALRTVFAGTLPRNEGLLITLLLEAVELTLWLWLTGRNGRALLPLGVVLSILGGRLLAGSTVTIAAVASVGESLHTVSSLSSGRVLAQGIGIIVISFVLTASIDAASEGLLDKSAYWNHLAAGINTAFQGFVFFLWPVWIHLRENLPLGREAPYDLRVP